MKRTPLKRTGSLRRTGPIGVTAYSLLRSTPVKAVSAKRAAENRERRKVVAQMFADNPLCILPGCTRFAAHPHEPLTRARLGSITDKDNILPVCAEHHQWIHEHPIEAEALGLLVHSWNRKGLPRRCPD